MTQRRITPLAQAYIDLAIIDEQVMFYTALLHANTIGINGALADGTILLKNVVDYIHLANVVLRRLWLLGQIREAIEELKGEE